MGPEIARNTVDFVPGHLYAGCFFSVAAVQLVSLGFLSGVKIPKPELTGSGGRPIGRFFKMPIFVVGVISAAIGYAMMSYMMTATPLRPMRPLFNGMLLPCLRLPFLPAI